MEWNWRHDLPLNGIYVKFIFWNLKKLIEIIFLCVFIFFCGFWWDFILVNGNEVSNECNYQRHVLCMDNEDLSGSPKGIAPEMQYVQRRETHVDLSEQIGGRLRRLVELFSFH